MTPSNPASGTNEPPIAVRWAETWHDVQCGTDHPLSDHEPFDTDDSDISWSEIEEAAGRNGLRFLATERATEGPHQHKVNAGCFPSCPAHYSRAERAIGAVIDVDSMIRVAAKLACEDHYRDEHLNQIPPCAGAIRDAEYWADKMGLLLASETPRPGAPSGG